MPEACKPDPNSAYHSKKAASAGVSERPMDSDCAVCTYGRFDASTARATCVPPVTDQTGLTAQLYT